MMYITDAEHSASNLYCSMNAFMYSMHLFEVSQT
jgi:hypothetical protein